MITSVNLYQGNIPIGQIALPHNCNLLLLWKTILKEFNETKDVLLLLLSTRKRYLIYLHPISPYLSDTVQLSQPISRKISNRKINK